MLRGGDVKLVNPAAKFVIRRDATLKMNQYSEMCMARKTGKTVAGVT